MAKIDFTDEDEVLREVAKAIDFPVEDLKIRSARNLESFGAGDVYEITSRGNKEWYVVEDSGVERELAVAIVKQDLEHEPEIFNRSFIESHIDTEKLRGALYSDTYDSNYDMCNDEAKTNLDDFWQRYEGEGFDAPEEDDEGNRREPKSKEIDALAESLTKQQLKDPMGYLEDIYGRGEEATKKAIEIAGIDVDAAAEEAVSSDGPGHFLSSYDGETHETRSGLVYWRQN